jgi:hypothetical protein
MITTPLSINERPYTYSVNLNGQTNQSIYIIPITMDSIRNKNNLRGTPPNKVPKKLPDSYLIESKDKLPDVTCIDHIE